MTINNEKPFIAGNWKMHKIIPEAVEMVKALAEASSELTAAELVVIPPYTMLNEVKMNRLTFLEAINKAVDEEMQRDPTVFILGEDVRAMGAPLGEFKGLFDRYGPERVIDTPISETAILGGAIGAAATGMRPIANIMYANFLGVCGDELINQLTQMRYIFGGKIKMPVTRAYFPLRPKSISRVRTSWNSV